MSIRTTQKTPVAVLGGLRDEGLGNPTPMKEQENMHQSTVPTRIQLDDFTVIDVDPREQHAEFTISARDVFGDTRSTFGIALTPEEARKVAAALLDSVAPAYGRADLEELEEHNEVARRLPQTESLTPAKYAARLRAETHR